MCLKITHLKISYSPRHQWVKSYDSDVISTSTVTCTGKLMFQTSVQPKNFHGSSHICWTDLICSIKICEISHQTFGPSHWEYPMCWWFLWTLNVTKEGPGQLQLSCWLKSDGINLLEPSDTIQLWRSWSTLVQVMAWCLTAPSHYLNQCWLISKLPWHSSEDIVIRSPNCH